jgi:Leucine-rich repeat (LRR) protein
MCSGGDVYWYDSCGTKGSKVAECNSASCQAGACFRDCSGPLTFDDPQFEAAVRAYAGKPSGTLYWTDTSGMTLFDPSGVNVTDITSIGGIECLTNLQVINVGSNPVSDLSPLRNGLTQLYYVAFWGDNVTDISPLVDIPSLTYVDVTGNPLNCNTQQQYIDTLQSRGATVFHDCD